MNVSEKQLDEVFQRHLGYEPHNALRFFCPGRVNLIGEHIDYNGGSVLPVAISLGIYAIVLPRRDAKIRIHSDTYPGHLEFDSGSLHSLGRQKNWTDYVIGSLQQVFEPADDLPGADVCFYSDLPAGAGLSSSAALEVLSGYIFLTLSDSTINRTRLALNAQKAEREFIGVNCGIMDQFIVANGEENSALLLDCSSLRHSQIPVTLPGYSLIIVNTAKSRELVGSEYNNRRADCKEALAQIRHHKPVQSLCDADPSDLPLITNLQVRKRACHAIMEHKRVKDAVQALSDKDSRRFGKLLFESHDSLRHDFEVSCPELDAIVEFCRNHPDCIGARMTGAGFGGCAIAFVKTDSIGKFACSLNKDLGFDLYMPTISSGVHLML
jgi:galactokinase